MAKRKRLDPARMLAAGPVPEAPTRAPIADVAGEAAGAAALSEMESVLTRARAEGRLIQSLPLVQIDASYLVRDRMITDADEMAALKDSLRERGQQMPIEVADLGEGRRAGRWGLISGWRRLQALKELSEAPDGPSEALAIVRSPKDSAQAYQAMVEENEVRVNLSYYERARIVARATDLGVYRVDRVALAKLFASATASRRSKIGSFVRIVRALEGVLRFPSALPEKRGLALAQALDAHEGLPGQIEAEIARVDPDTAAEEAEVIDHLLASLAAPEDAAPLPKPVKKHKGAAAAPEVRTFGGDLSAALHPDGRIMLRGDRLADPVFREGLMAYLEGKTGSK